MTAHANRKSPTQTQVHGQTRSANCNGNGKQRPSCDECCAASRVNQMSRIIWAACSACSSFAGPKEVSIRCRHSQLATFSRPACSRLTTQTQPLRLVSCVCVLYAFWGRHKFNLVKSFVQLVRKSTISNEHTRSNQKPETRNQEPGTGKPNKTHRRTEHTAARPATRTRALQLYRRCSSSLVPFPVQSDKFAALCNSTRLDSIVRVYATWTI